MGSSIARRGASTTTAATFLPKLLSQKPSSIFIFPSINRFLATKTTTTNSTSSTVPPSSSAPNDDGEHPDFDPPVVVYGPPRKFKMENPFQSHGPRNVIEVDPVNDGTLVRLALPGVGDGGFRVWADNNTVFFAGKGDVEHEQEDSGRKYAGSLEFDAEFHRADGVKAEIKNGILRLLVPNAEGVEKNKEK